MPTSTYFRLPEEKRERLLAACWSEITRVRFADVSVNRIIGAANIPRGSFYQYFTDKEDMIRYLLLDMREYFVDMLRGILIESRGDLFAFPLKAFDQFVRRGTTDPHLGRFIDVLRLNQGMDTQSMMADCPGFLPDPLWDLVDTGLLKEQSRSYADQVFHLLCAVLAYAVAGTLQEPARREDCREILKNHMNMLRYGCAAQSAPCSEEVTI